jgi:DNA-directed RNA polymerase subunit beta'
MWFLDPKETPLLKKQLLNEKEYRESVDKYGEESFDCGMGAESVKVLLADLKLDALSAELKQDLKLAVDKKELEL